MIVFVALKLPAVAVIVTVPVFNPVTVPLPDTVARSLSEEYQFTVPRLAPAGIAVANNCI